VSRTGAPGAPRAAVMEVFQCQSCSEVIGVYEPLVLREGVDARTTSRAAEPGLEAKGAAYYHRDCHADAVRRAQERKAG
jgi:hypothetical protein